MSSSTPPLLPPSSPPARPCWGRPVYTALTRRLPPPALHPAVTAAASKHAHKGNGASLWWVVQRSLGVAAPLSVAVMGGVVGGPHAPSALLLGGLVALMAGLCYCELVTRQSGSDRGSVGYAAEGGPYRAFYLLVGELPAYCVAASWLLSLATLVAACSVALSGTMNFLTGDRLNKSLHEVWGGRLMGDQIPLDPVAAAATIVTSLLLSLGLEQAWFLRLVMNVSSLLVLLLFVIIGGANVPPVEERPRVHEPNLADVVSSAAVFSTLFLGVFEVARLSKARRPRCPSPPLRARRPLRRLVPLASALLVAGVVVATFPLGLVLTLITGGGEEIASSTPLLEALKMSHLSWPIVVLGALQVVMLGLALVQGLDQLCVLITELAEDGLFPRCLAAEHSCSHARSGAALLAGLLAAGPALCFQLKTLLQASSCGMLLLDVAVVLAALYRRHRCAYASLCSSSSSPKPSPAEGSTQRGYAVSHSRPVVSFREGLHNLTASIGRDAPAAADDSDGTPLLEIIGGGPFDSPRHDPSLAGHSLESACSGYGSDTENSDDVDAAVAWYKERVRVTSRGTAVVRSPPTSRSALQALILLVVVTVCLTTVVGILLYLPLITVTVTLSVSFSLLSTLLLLLLSRLPVLATSQGTSFSVPGAPWVPATVLVLVLALLLQILPDVAFVIGPYTAAALGWYAVFGWWSSNVRRGLARPKDEEAPPCTVTRACSSHSLVSSQASVTGNTAAADSFSSSATDDKRTAADCQEKLPTEGDSILGRNTSGGSDHRGGKEGSGEGLPVTDSMRTATIGMAKLSLPSQLQHDSPSHEPLSSIDNLAA